MTPGSELGLASTDRLRTFAQAILIIRWGTTAVSLVLASTGLQENDSAVTVAVVGLVAYTLFRTLRPLRYDERNGLLLVLAETAGTVLAIVFTGYWESPLVFSVLTATAVAGFARGFGFGLRVAAAAALAVSIPWSFEEAHTAVEGRISLQWSAELLLVGIVAGYARRLSVEYDERESLALDRLSRLADANDLLVQLHELAQTLPASLGLQDVLDAATAQLGEAFDSEATVVLLVDDTDGRWHCVRRSGAPSPASFDPHGLPPAVAEAAARGTLVQRSDPGRLGGAALVDQAGSGLYAPLVARGTTIGMLVLEHGEPAHFGERDAELLAGVAEPAALAIDNARWFGRLRTLGADEERSRIARDLHDRIGQSLAYLAFELDRIVKQTSTEPPVAAALDQLREEVRRVIREVRDTLYDLRTDVTEAQGLPATLDGFLARVRERSDLTVTLRSEATDRLPILQEREMWRIAQEALRNVERHARAGAVEVSWSCDGTTAVLEVSDDGVGFVPGEAGRVDSYGILGMRERAASIGARLTVTGGPGRGTRVRCALSRQ